MGKKWKHLKLKKGKNKWWSGEERKIDCKLGERKKRLKKKKEQNKKREDGKSGKYRKKKKHKEEMEAVKRKEKK